MTEAKTDRKPIQFAVIQDGFALFGAGHSYAAAVEDAAEWMEDADGRQGGMTVDQVDDIIGKPDKAYGSFRVIDKDHPEFASYLRHNGGFTEINGAWYAD